MNRLWLFILLLNLKQVCPEDVEDDANIVNSVQEEPLKIEAMTKLDILNLLKKHNAADKTMPMSATQNRLTVVGHALSAHDVFKKYGIPFEVRNISASEPFYLFKEEHSRAMLHLMEFLTAAGSLDEIIELSQAVRPYLHEDLFKGAFTNVLMNMNADTELPPVSEEFPEDFVDGTFFKTVETYNKSQNTVSVEALENGQYLITQALDLDGENPIPENKVAYFREDYGLNSHHYYWHSQHNSDNIPRKNEYFIYMHSQMLKRYQIERLAMGLPIVVPYSDFRSPIEVGHHPNLGKSHDKYGIRNDNIRPMDHTNLTILYDRQRLLKSMLQRNIVNDSKFIEALESYHNKGHMNIAEISDMNGVMANPQVAARDTVFYRWHAHIDDVAQQYQVMKRRVTSTWLTYQQLAFKDIQVKQVDVISSDTLNQLQTGCGFHQVDVSGGLTFALKGRARVNMIHLDHVPYTYHIQVKNLGSQPKNGVVRIFLAPQYDVTGYPMDIEQQRNFWIEMDKFMYHFNPGFNYIKQTSSKSSVTVDCRDSFDDIAERALKDEAPRKEGHCGCGWPQHLLVPRGTPEGMIFTLFVIVTYEPNVKEWRLNPSTHCGHPSRELSDQRPMGYPFHAPAPEKYRTISKLADSLPNAAVREVSIRFTGLQTNQTEVPIEGCGKKLDT